MHLLFPYLARWRSANWSRYHQLLTALARRGHHILVLQPPSRPGVRETNFSEVECPPIPGIEVLDLDIPARLWRSPFPMDRLFKRGLATLAARRIIKELARRHAIDVLLLYNIPQVFLARAVKGTVVVDVADDLLAMLAHEAAGWARGATMSFGRRALRRLIAAADIVTTPSTVLAEQLGGMVHVLPNGVDLAALAQADGKEIRARYAPPILGFVGAFEYFVDFSLLLDVAARLRTCTVLLVGSGREEPAVRASARQRGLTNVHFVSAVPYREALNHMAAMDVALIPFRSSPVADAASPLKLFEYMGLRRPVVSTPTHEIRRIVGDVVHFAVTASEWVETIRRIVMTPQVAAAKIDRAYEKIQTRFRWDLLAGQWEHLIVAAANGELEATAPAQGDSDQGHSPK